jgi:hypothetical protein
MKRTFHWLVLNIFLFSVSAQPARIGGFNIYYGSLHNHCSISDGKGSALDAYSSAKTNAGFDFFALTDHGELMSPGEWSTIKNTADDFNENGVFAALWGFEWSSPAYGHVVVLGSNDYCMAIVGSVASFSRLVHWVESRECLAFFAHPGYADDNGTEFSHFNTFPSDKFFGMELWNGSDNFDRYYVNNGYFKDDGGLGYYDEAMQRGWKIGAAGNEDNHNANWGNLDSRMAVLAGDLTRSSVWEALRSRRFYSTLDKNLEISFKIRGEEMGSTLPSGSYEGEIRLHDADNESFTKVELLRNGTLYETFSVHESAPVISFSVDAAPGDYYYIVVYQEDGGQAITSPVFFDDPVVVGLLPELNGVFP